MPIRHQFFTPSTNRLLIVISFLIGGALLVYALSGVPRPRERDRVSSADRLFSMIHPPDWDVDHRVGDDRSTYVCALATSPKKSVGRETRMFFGEYKNPIDQPTLLSGGYAAIRFQDQPAWARTIKSKHDFTYMMIFERDGRGYEISIRLPTAEDVPHSDWWDYFQSFRTHAPATTATSPS